MTDNKPTVAESVEQPVENVETKETVEQPTETAEQVSLKKFLAGNPTNADWKKKFGDVNAQYILGKNDCFVRAMVDSRSHQPENKTAVRFYDCCALGEKVIVSENVVQTLINIKATRGSWGNTIAKVATGLLGLAALDEAYAAYKGQDSFVKQGVDYAAEGIADAFADTGDYSIGGDLRTALGLGAATAAAAGIAYATGDSINKLVDELNLDALLLPVGSVVLVPGSDDVINVTSENKDILLQILANKALTDKPVRNADVEWNINWPVFLKNYQNLAMVSQ
jgi:hypothetical protein